MNINSVRNKLNLGYSLNSINLRVTFYSRVSTDSELQKKSLFNQVEFFEKMIKENERWIYVDGYIDDGISGTTDIKRVSFMKMISDAKSGLFDLIITKEISRFSRNTLDSIKYTRLLLSYGVGVLFINDNINTLLSDSELRLTIMASMAQDEIRRLSERVKFGMNRAIERGELLGNNIIFGYRKDKDKLVVVDEESVIVKGIFDMYVNKDYSLSMISKYLNDNGVYTIKNCCWSSSTVSRIIKNPKYKGYYCAKKSEVIDYINKKIKYNPKDEWIIYKDNEKIPPIVDEHIWNKANKKIMCINKNINHNKYIYSSKIICACGYVLYKRNNLWICSNYLNNGKKCCNVKVLESDFTDIFKVLYNMLNINFDIFKDVDLSVIYDNLISFFIKKVLVKIKIIFLNNYIIYIKNISFNEFVINCKNCVVKFVNVC